MAKKCMTRRENKRERLVAKHQQTRDALKKIMKDPEASLEEKREAIKNYAKMPKDASKVRRTYRCQVTGRARGVWRKFKLCRHVINQAINNGIVPGFQKSSW